MAIPAEFARLAQQVAAANAAKNARNIRATGATTGEAARFAAAAPVGFQTKAPKPTPKPTTLAQQLRNTGATTGEAQRFADISAARSQRVVAPVETVAPVQTTAPVTTAPVTTAPVTTEPVQITPEPSPVPIETVPDTGAEVPVEAPQAPTYNVYDDPFYQQALAAAQSAFNLDRASALANTQYQQRGIQRQLEERIPAAEAERRRLAGNFARRGMAGGRYGALTRAEAEVNARETALRTGLREQIAELNRQYISQFGAPGTDWMGTRRGFEAQQAAIQQALQNRLAGLTTVG